MFSKELYEMDRNTVRYMIDELQEENRRQKQELEEKDFTLKEALRRIKELEGNNQ